MNANQEELRRILNWVIEHRAICAHSQHWYLDQLARREDDFTASESVWIRQVEIEMRRKETEDMAKKTKRSSSPEKSKGEIKCKFGKVSIGKDVVSVPVKIERSAISLDSADHLFTQMRSNAVLRCDPNANEDAEGQMTIGDQAIELQHIVECGGFSARADAFGATLNINKADADLSALSQFAARTGTLELTKPVKIEKKVKEAEESDPAE